MALRPASKYLRAIFGNTTRAFSAAVLCRLQFHTPRRDNPFRHLAEKSRALQRRTISANCR